uniref:Uncharacterized protein n=1 Tax=Anopheles albimanus TaxID=7167 RepID=A0A182FJZ6_ANOAL
METVARSIALGQGLHPLLPVGAVGLGCGGLLLPPQKPLATLAVNGSTQSNTIGSSTSSILGKRPLAPATGSMTTSSTTAAVTAATSSMSLSAKSLAEQRSKVTGPVSTVGKKYAYSGLPYATPQQSASVQRRNARERNRVKLVNNGFANLRQHIPSSVVTALTNGTRGANKKLSKVDTLRLAVQYINSLKRMLEENVGSAELGLTVAGGTPKQQKPTSSSTVTSSTTPTTVAATISNSNQLQQLSNSSVCSASSGSTYYGTMSEPSIASSPAPSHMSDGSSHGGDSGTPHPGCFTQISGSFKHEPYDLYVDPLNSPTPSYGSDHGIGGIGAAQSSYHHHHHHHHHHHQQQQQQQQHLASVAGHQTIVHDGPPSTTIQSATDSNNYILAAQPHLQHQHQHQHQQHHQTLQHQHQHQFKTELAYDDSPYDEELSPQNPDDEELLDAISWWQQQ